MENSFSINTAHCALFLSELYVCESSCVSCQMSQTWWRVIQQRIKADRKTGSKKVSPDAAHAPEKACFHLGLFSWRKQTAAVV